MTQPNDANVEVASERADSAIRWATGRAATIAALPLPLADVYPLIANELYMVKEIGEAYGLRVDEATAKGVLTAVGASFAGLALASFLPGVKVGIAAAITYAAGKAAKLWCAGGGQVDLEELRSVFERERRGHDPRA